MVLARMDFLLTIPESPVFGSFLQGQILPESGGLLAVSTLCYYLTINILKNYMTLNKYFHKKS
jgi:hypothetical protein